MSSSTARKKNSDEDRLDQVFTALSDRTRRALLRRLATGPAMVSELAEPFAMSRIAVSKHLRVLEDAALVSREIDGRVHQCSLAAAPLIDAHAWLRQYESFWRSALTSLAAHAAHSGARKTSARGQKL